MEKNARWKILKYLLGSGWQDQVPVPGMEGFTLNNVTGSCGKGISLANIRKAVINNINVTGFSGPLLGIHNVSGKGLEGAAAIDAPKVPDPIVAGAQTYQLR